MKTLFSSLLALLLLLSFSSCTVIEITHSDGEISIERNFGFSVVNIAPDSGATISKISSLGFNVNPLGYSIGMNRQVLATMDNNCRMMLWVDENTDIQLLESVIRDVDTVCIVE